MVKPILLRLLIYTAVIIIFIRYIESRVIFFPMKGVPSTGGGITHQDIFFQTEDGKKLHGWYIPAPASDRGAPVVLFLHGNAGNLGHRWEKIDILHRLGASVFIFDYRGYGRSEGRPSEKGLYRDTDAAYAYLVEHGTSPENIILYGESIGGAFAVDLAGRKSVRALILESTFTSIAAMVRRSMPFIPSFILATRLDSLHKIPAVSVPKLIFHSVDDEIVPFEMGKALFEAAVEPKRMVQLRGGHNTAFLDDLENYRSSLAKFISEPKGDTSLN